MLCVVKYCRYNPEHDTESRLLRHRAAALQDVANSYLDHELSEDFEKVRITTQLLVIVRVQLRCIDVSQYVMCQKNMYIKFIYRRLSQYYTNVCLYVST